jgi:hypothetical protein
MINRASVWVRLAMLLLVCSCADSPADFTQPGAVVKLMRRADSAETYLVKGPGMVRKGEANHLGGFAVESKGPDLSKAEVALLCRLLERPCDRERGAMLCTFNPRFGVHFQRRGVGIELLYCPGCKQTAFCKPGERGLLEGVPAGFSLCAVDSLEGLFYGVFPHERHPG